MDEKLLAVLIGVLSGAIGYWVTTFWMRPILQYRDLRSKVLVDLIFYAQVVNADNLNGRMQELYNERTESNRRSAAELVACLLELPFWYKWWLRLVRQTPSSAATNLIGLSNTNEYEPAEQRVLVIKKALGIRTEAI